MRSASCATSAGWTRSLAQTGHRTSGIRSSESSSPNGSRAASELIEVHVSQFVADPLARASQEARDVHLRDADARRDLGLRQTLLEAEAQHQAVAVVERVERAGDEQPRLDLVVPRLVHGHAAVL